MDTSLFNFYNFIGTEMSIAIIIFNLLLSFALQLAIVWVYKKTHRGLSYSESFLFTLVMIGVLGSVVMMVVQNNLVGAFALLGAFSLIRFRTIVKETRDVAFVFFALAVGVGVGTNNYIIAIITTLFLSGMIMVLWRYRIGIGTNDGLGYILTVTSNLSLQIETLESLLNEHATLDDVLHAKYRKDSGGHYAFSLHITHIGQLQKIKDVLSTLGGVERFEFITTKHTVEY